MGVLLLTQFNNAFGQDYLETVTVFGNGITTDNSKAWTDIDMVTIDVTNITRVLVVASVNMRPDGVHTSGREANYNIYRSGATADNSGVIKRETLKNTDGTGVESWGIGTLVHVFDTSTLSGNITYVLEHSNQATSSVDRNIFSTARLSAIALTTEINGYELSNDVKRLDAEVTTTSATFTAVSGLTSNAINLPIAGDIYVAASIDSRANGSGSVGEYKLEYSPDGGSNWFDLGKPVKRSMINNFDDGIVSLVGLLQNQDIGSNYQFRVSHRRVSGNKTIFTHNANLVAIALSHSDGFFPSFFSDVSSPGIDITGISAPKVEITSSSFAAAVDISGIGTGLYVHAQYLVNASGLNESTPQRMRARNQLFLDDGVIHQESDAYFRYSPNNSVFGSGGFIGLAEDLVSEGSYTIGMEHNIDDISAPDSTEDETLTTSEVILTGFQTYDQPNPLLSVDNVLFAQQINIFGSHDKIEIRSDKLINAKINIYNIIGQLINTKQLNRESSASINIFNYKGVAIVSVTTDDGQVLNKKVILW